MVVNLPLGGLRAIARAFLPDLAVIARFTETNTADGVTQTWTTIASDVACSVWPIGTGATERAPEAAGQLRGISEWNVRLPALTDVTVRDRVTITTTPDGPDGRLFEVLRVDVRAYEAARDCICALIT